MQEIEITVNDETRAMPSGSTLGALVETLNLTGKPIAIEVNGCIVSANTFAKHPLQNNDRIEIVTLMGGG
ncbi:MAG: sulfur carrier protein ThiS [Pirellulaceae bacterium]